MNHNIPRILMYNAIENDLEEIIKEIIFDMENVLMLVKKM